MTEAHYCDAAQIRCDHCDCYFCPDCLGTFDKNDTNVDNRRFYPLEPIPDGEHPCEFEHECHVCRAERQQVPATEPTPEPGTADHPIEITDEMTIDDMTIGELYTLQLGTSDHPIYVY